MPEKNGWTEWSKYVLKELERLAKAVEKAKDDIVYLKIKSSFWGVVGGAIAALITMLIVHHFQ